jgi:hypothetical protein
LSKDRAAHYHPWLASSGPIYGLAERNNPQDNLIPPIALEKQRLLSGSERPHAA